MAGRGADFAELLQLLQNQVAVILPYLVNLLDLFGQLFQIILAGIIVRGGLIHLVAQVGDFLGIQALALLHLRQSTGFDRTIYPVAAAWRRPERVQAELLKPTSTPKVKSFSCVENKLPGRASNFSSTDG